MKLLLLSISLLSFSGQAFCSAEHVQNKTQTDGYCWQGHPINQCYNLKRMFAQKHQLQHTLRQVQKKHDPEQSTPSNEEPIQLGKGFYSDEEE